MLILHVMLPWEQISSALVMVAVVMRKLLMNWMRLVSTTQKTTTRNFVRNIQTGWFMVQKHLQQPVHVVAIIVLNKNWYIATKLIVTMNSQIMGMIVLVGVKRQPLHGPLTVTTLAMLDSLSGQVRIISVNLHHGTIKTKLPLRALTLVS